MRPTVDPNRVYRLRVQAGYDHCASVYEAAWSAMIAYTEISFRQIETGAIGAPRDQHPPLFAQLGNPLHHECGFNKYMLTDFDNPKPLAGRYGSYACDTTGDDPIRDDYDHSPTDDVDRLLDTCLSSASHVLDIGQDRALLNS